MHILPEKPAALLTLSTIGKSAEMAPLTERQRKADVLASELRTMGAAVVNPMPLADGANLRFRILDSLSAPVLEALREGDWDAHFVSSGPEFRLDGSTPLAHVYEVGIPSPCTPIWDGRIPAFKLATGERGAQVSWLEINGTQTYRAAEIKA
jgi:hypothetical protein